MKLNDTLITIACLGVGFATIPSIVTAEKPHLWMCILTIACLLMFTLAYGRMKLWFSTASEIFCLVMWFILLGQVIMG